MSGWLRAVSGAIVEASVADPDESTMTVATACAAATLILGVGLLLVAVVPG
jgi:hypothetical protein